MKRIEFIRNVVGGSILFTAPVVFSSCGDDDLPSPNKEGNSNIAELDLTKSKYDDLNSLGGYVYEGNIIVIRSSESGYIALSKICTHQGCEVGYDHQNSKLPCPCHGSEFDTSGNVLQGPASEKLTKYNTKIDGDKLIIS